MSEQPEQPLYKDKQLEIDYLPTSPEDHILTVRGDERGINYLIPRGILNQLALTKRGGIESMIATFNEGILHAIKREHITVDGLHVAICQAYIEEERRVSLFVAEFRESQEASRT